MIKARALTQGSSQCLCVPAHVAAAKLACTPVGPAVRLHGCVRQRQASHHTTHTLCTASQPCRAPRQCTRCALRHMLRRYVWPTRARLSLTQPVRAQQPHSFGVDSCQCLCGFRCSAPSRYAGCRVKRRCRGQDCTLVRFRFVPLSKASAAPGCHYNSTLNSRTGVSLFYPVT